MRKLLAKYLTQLFDQTSIGQTYWSTLISRIFGYGAGTKNGSTVTAVEYGINNVVQKTVLTLASTTVTMTKNGTSTAGGGVKIYDFPEGYIKVLGVTSNLAVAGEGTTSFLASLGTVAAGTDGSLSSTEADICASTAASTTSGAGTCKMKGDIVSALDGTGTAKDLYLNTALNADGTGKEAVAYTGTITLYWINLGDN